MELLGFIEGKFGDVTKVFLIEGKEIKLINNRCGRDQGIRQAEIMAQGVGFHERYKFF